MMSGDPNPETLKTIQSHAFGLLETLVEIRRDLHMHPELSGEEGWTASYIADRLKDLPLEIHTGIGGHGIVADLVTDPGRPMVALRVEMDALPIQEINAVPYRSQVPGVMQDPPENLCKFIIYDASLDDEEPSFYQGQFGLGIKAADPHLRKAALGRVRAALNPICRVRHIRYYIEPMGSMPDVRNDRDLVQATLPALQVALGEENLIHLGAAFPFNCEDFAFFAERIPGAMVWLGAADPVVGKYAMLHTADFDVDERCLVTGVTAMAVLLRKALLTHPF